ncbi:MAG: T9SS type A sorting domain-containing protein [Flavobacteriales bacterium]|nr:T9SS type A sorting domain-containing protein [Flavobacteriales bacterium]
MKKIFTLLAASMAMLWTNAQNPTVTLSTSTACVGETVTATLVSPELNLASSATGTNQHNGVMFDVVGVEGAVIKGFLVNVNQADTDFEIYYRTGSYAGFENSSVGWTLLGSSTGIATGTDVNTGIDLDLTILPGQTLGFYITCTDAVNQFIQYANGTVEGTQLAANVYLTINSGVGKAYPFADTFTPRDFIGQVIYEPVLTNITWSDNVSTDVTADYTISRSMGIIAAADYGSATHKGSTILTVNDYRVEATATPTVLGWDEASTITTTVTKTTGLGTMFTGGNNQNGAMFDVAATNALVINGFSVYPMALSSTADVQIFYKTGTFVGSETNSGAWTNVGSASGLVEEQDSYVPLTSPLALAPGQTMAFYITRTDGGYLNYTNTTAVGDVVNSDANLTVRSGTGMIYPFDGVYPARMLNTIVHYEVENPAGLNYAWSPGGEVSGSIVVTPNADATYTVTVDDGSCEATGDVSVTMALGIEHEHAATVNVYPNPANEFVNLRAETPVNMQNILLMDASGKVVFQHAPNGAFTNLTIPVGQLARGLYILKMNVDGQISTRKVEVR